MSFVEAVNLLHNVIWFVFLVLCLLIFFSTRLKGQALLAPFVDAINRVNINVWMIVVLAGGIVLACCGQKEQGGQLVIGAFAILRGGEHTTPGQPADPPAIAQSNTSILDVKTSIPNG